MKNILFVLNPISGDIDKETALSVIQDYCKTSRFNFELYKTTGQQDEAALKGLLNRYQPDVVVVMGGDGTVSLVAHALNHTPTPMAIIPLGSGNGLSKDLGIPQDITEALDLLKTGKVRRIDSLDVNGKIAFHLCDLGFNARVVKLFNEGDTRGPAAYAKIAFQEYLSFEPFSYKIETDAETFEGPAFMLTIANANAFGSNAAINPEGEVDDGIFEICLIEPFPAMAALGLLYDLYNNSIQKSIYSRILKCRRATIYKDSPDVLQIDGEPVSVGNTLKITVHKKSLSVLVPSI